MSISSEITRLSGNVSSAFGAVSQMGGTVPSGANSDDLATSIRSIPQSGGGSGLPAVDSTDNGKVLTVVNGAWDKAEAKSDVLWVNGLLDLQTMSIASLDKTYQQVSAAVSADKDVKLKIQYYTSPSNIAYGIGNLAIIPDVSVSSPYAFEWGLLLYGDFGTGTAMHYFHIKLDSDETVFVSYRLVTSSFG